jgi:hypothetical protein
LAGVKVGILIVYLATDDIRAETFNADFGAVDNQDVLRIDWQTPTILLKIIQIKIKFYLFRPVTAWTIRRDMALPE